MRTHPAKVVVHGAMAAEVDLELAPLVLEIWRAGIETIHSCQDVGENIGGLAAQLPHLAETARRELGRASIGFPAAEPMMVFLEALANAGPRDLFYERMAHWASRDAWQLVLGIQDLALERDEDEDPGAQGLAPDGTPRSRFGVVSFQVRFPRGDATEMTERMRRHNRGDAVPLGRPTWAAITVPADGVGDDAGGASPPTAQGA